MKPSVFASLMVARGEKCIQNGFLLPSFEVEGFGVAINIGNGSTVPVQIDACA